LILTYVNVYIARLAALVRPALTTMRIDIAGFGRRALERLVQILEQPEAAHDEMEHIRPALVVRDSCGAAQDVALARG
jgi:LacI family transcriptional regulator